MSRKVHAKVVLDVFFVADDDADLEDILGEMQFEAEDETGKADIQDVKVTEEIRITDVR